MLRTIPQSPGAYRIRRLSRAAAVARRSDATKKQKERYNALLHEMGTELDKFEKAKDQAGDLDQACKDCGDKWYDLPLDIRTRIVLLLQTLDVDLGGR